MQDQLEAPRRLGSKMNPVKGKQKLKGDTRTSDQDRIVLQL